MKKFLIGLFALGSLSSYAGQTPIRVELSNGLTLVALLEAVPSSARTQVTNPYLYVEGRVDSPDENIGLRENQADKVCSLLELGKAIYVANGNVNSPYKISKALKSKYFEQFSGPGILYLTCSLDLNENRDRTRSERQEYPRIEHQGRPRSEHQEFPCQ